MSLSARHRAPLSYWADSRRPLVSLVFLLPLLALYECGVFWLNGDQAGTLRNGADTWMRNWLLQLGFDRPWILPLLIVGILATWHLVVRHPWRVSSETLLGMSAESLLCALLLLVSGQMLSLWFRHLGLSPLVGAPPASLSERAVHAVSFIGAGIYEEVLFRLMLLPALFVVLRALLIPTRTSAVLAVLGSSLVFSMAHYLQPASAALTISLEPMTTAAHYVCETPALWFGFGFRLLAGLVFAGLFLMRGFGVTVGCHAFYDLLVGVLMTSPE